MSDLLVAERAGIVSLSLNRPQKRNALTRSLLSELQQVLTDAQQRSDLRGLVLTATGTVFCAGMDLAEMRDTAVNPDAEQLWQQDAELYADVLARLFALPCPTIASLPGPALAGGVGLVAACDLVLATHNTTFTLPEPQRGLVAALVTPLLVYRVGAGPAGWMLLSGQSLSATQAVQWGLIHQLVPPEELPPQLERACQSLLTQAPHATALTKQHLQKLSAAEMQAQLQAGVSLSGRVRGLPEAHAGLQAFLDRRPPDWQPQPPPS